VVTRPHCSSARESTVVHDIDLDMTSFYSVIAIFCSPRDTEILHRHTAPLYIAVVAIVSNAEAVGPRRWHIHSGQPHAPPPRGSSTLPTRGHNVAHELLWEVREQTSSVLELIDVDDCACPEPIGRLPSGDVVASFQPLAICSSARICRCRALSALVAKSRIASTAAEVGGRTEGWSGAHGMRPYGRDRSPR
jgi:hypothetical protein